MLLDSIISIYSYSEFIGVFACLYHGVVPAPHGIVFLCRMLIGAWQSAGVLDSRLQASVTDAPYLVPQSCDSWWTPFMVHAAAKVLLIAINRY